MEEKNNPSCEFVLIIRDGFETLLKYGDDLESLKKYAERATSDHMEIIEIKRSIEFLPSRKTWEPIDNKFRKG